MRILGNVGISECVKLRRYYSSPSDPKGCKISFPHLTHYFLRALWTAPVPHPGIIERSNFPIPNPECQVFGMTNQVFGWTHNLPVRTDTLQLDHWVSANHLRYHHHCPLIAKDLWKFPHTLFYLINITSCCYCKLWRHNNGISEQAHICACSPIYVHLFQTQFRADKDC